MCCAVISSHISALRPLVSQLRRHPQLHYRTCGAGPCREVQQETGGPYGNAVSTNVNGEEMRTVGGFLPGFWSNGWQVPHLFRQEKEKSGQNPVRRAAGMDSGPPKWTDSASE